MLWTCTDGTRNGTAGIHSGTVSFAGGLPDPGNYEARLYPNSSSIVQASVPFSVSGAALQSTALTSQPASPSVGSEARLSLVRSGDKITLHCQCTPGQLVRVEASSDLVNWEPLGTVQVTDGATPVTTESTDALPYLFYRAVPTTANEGGVSAR